MEASPHRPSSEVSTGPSLEVSTDSSSQDLPRSFSPPQEMDSAANVLQEYRKSPSTPSPR